MDFRISPTLVNYPYNIFREEEEDVAGLIDDTEDPEVDEDRKHEKVQRLQRREMLANDDPEEFARYIEKRFGDNYDYEDLFSCFTFNQLKIRVAQELSKP